MSASSKVDQSNAPQRLVLVDGHGLAFRAFFALPYTMATASGELTNATFGFTSMLLEVLKAHAPDYLLVTFDTGRTFRHEQFEDYKAHRQPMPDELKPQIERMKGVLEALNVPIYEADGFEADDVIGTLSKQAAAQGLQALVVTGDSDLLQLVDEHVHVVMPGRQRFGEYRLYDREAVLTRYGFEPVRMIDFKALVGDKSDNIPGVPGIGEKTASALIADYPSLEAIYEHLDDITPTRARNALAGNRESAFFSRELATVIRDVPVDLDVTRCVVHDYDRDQVVEIFRELEFRSLLNRLPALPSEVGDEPEQAAPSGQLSKPRAVVTDDELHALAEEIAAAPMVAFDVETDGLSPLHSRLVGLALATAPERSYYVPLLHEDGPNAAAELARTLLGGALAEHRHLSAHNGKFDLAILETAGYPTPTLHYDTMLAAYLLGEHALGLKELAFNKFGWEMTPISALIGTGRNQITMDQTPVEAATDYAAADVEATLRLEELFTESLRARDQMRLLEEIEMPLVPILLRMERTGIALNPELLLAMSGQLESQIDEIRSEIFSAVGHEFNINSPAQLATVLFDEVGLPAGRKTKTGYSVGQEVLEGLRGMHEAVDLVLEYRSLTKLKSTYVDALPNQVDSETGRIHTTFNQTIAATGRLSSIDPNLQNIPVRNELGRKVRRAFIADNRPATRPFDEEAVLFGADYSQMELRLMAHYSGDPALVQAFKEGRDIHASTAAQVAGIPLEQVSRLQRDTAKAVNFGIMYGMSAYGVSRDTGMSRPESQAFIERYMSEFPGIRDFMKRAVEDATRLGYAESLFGRRRYLPDINTRGPRRQAAERAAINMPLQGTASDIMKMAMIELDRQLSRSGLRARLLLQVHDELIFETPVSEVPQLSELVTAAMRDVAELSVPMEVETKSGPNWEEMTPLG